METSRRALILLLVPAVLLGAYAFTKTVLADGETDCDLEKVEKAFYCEAQNLILVKKDLVSKKAYYLCAPCRETSKKPGKCEFCGKKREKMVSEPDACPKCYKKTLSVEVCVKNGYACPKCGETSSKPARCEACRAKYKKGPSRALVKYECSACMGSAYEAGKCGNEECKRKGEALVRICTQSGKPPHVGTKKP